MSENKVLNIAGVSKPGKSDAAKNAEVEARIKARHEESARIAELLRKGYEQANPEDYAILMREATERKAAEARALVKRVLEGKASGLDYLRHGYAKIDGKSADDAIRAEFEMGDRIDGDK